MIPPEALDFGEYRNFTNYDRDKFPGLPPKVTPLLIKETKIWTFVLGAMKDEGIVFVWDKISPLYNMYQGL